MELIDTEGKTGQRTETLTKDNSHYGVVDLPRTGSVVILNQAILLECRIRISNIASRRLVL
jgi:hypothetical protein